MIGTSHVYQPQDSVRQFFSTLASMLLISLYSHHADHQGRHRCEAEGFKSHKPGAAEAALFASAKQYFESAPFDPTDKIRCTNLPPIYFQHRGHSLTIVGLEQRSSGSLKLLVFDPMFRDPEGVLRLVGRVGRHGSAREDRNNNNSNNRTRSPIIHRSPDSVLKLYRRGSNYLRKYHEFELLRYVLFIIFFKTSQQAISLIQEANSFRAIADSDESPRQAKDDAYLANDRHLEEHTEQSISRPRDDGDA